MSILKTDTRYSIDTLISIAKATTSPTLRESLLEEALGLLRGGEDYDDMYGVEAFFSLFVSSDCYIRVGIIYNSYLKFCAENGHRALPRKKLVDAAQDRGIRLAIRNGYKVLFINFKENNNAE